MFSLTPLRVVGWWGRTMQLLPVLPDFKLESLKGTESAMSRHFPRNRYHHELRCGASKIRQMRWSSWCGVDSMLRSLRFQASAAIPVIKKVPTCPLSKYYQSKPFTHLHHDKYVLKLIYNFLCEKFSHSSCFSFKLLGNDPSVKSGLVSFSKCQYYYPRRIPLPIVLYYQVLYPKCAPCRFPSTFNY